MIYNSAIWKIQYAMLKICCSSKEDVLWEALAEVLPDLHIELAKLYLAIECEEGERERNCLQFGFLLKKKYDGLYFPNIPEVPGFEKIGGIINFC